MPCPAHFSAGIGGVAMEEIRRTEEKRKLYRILLHRFNRAFYPLARKSCTDGSRPLDEAFRSFLEKGGLPLSREKKLRDEVIRKYVSFRLALAFRMAVDMLAHSEEARRRVRSCLDFDVPRSFTTVFERKTEAAALYRTSADKVRAAEAVLGLLGEEVHCDLSPMLDFFRPETEGYEEAVREEILRYGECFSLVAPDFADMTEAPVPKLLEECFLEEMGSSYGKIICGNAAMAEPLSRLCLAPADSRKRKESYLFLYRYLLFRVYAASYFAACLWEDRGLVSFFRDGALNSEPLLRCIRGGLAKDFLSAEDLTPGRDLYRAIDGFMSRWKMFDPEEPDRYYRYTPDFLRAVSAGTEAESFGRRAETLFRALVPGFWDGLSRREKDSLTGELQMFLNNLSRSLYFSRDMGFRTAADFVSDVYRPREKRSGGSWMKGLVRFFGRR